MTQEFTATRTMLANTMATAGAELLQYMKTAGALAAIPNTEPQQYVVAGTLEIIGKLLPAVAPAAQAQAELTDERIKEIIAANFADDTCTEDDLAFARAIEREVRSAAREQARNEALDAERYRFLRSKMCFSGGKDVGTTMTMRVLIPAPDHNFHTDWVGERFDVSVDATVDRAIAAAVAEDDEAPAASKEGDTK